MRRLLWIEADGSAVGAGGMGAASSAGAAAAGMLAPQPQAARNQRCTSQQQLLSQLLQQLFLQHLWQLKDARADRSSDACGSSSSCSTSRNRCCTSRRGGTAARRSSSFAAAAAGAARAADGSRTTTGRSSRLRSRKPTGSHRSSSSCSSGRNRTDDRADHRTVRRSNASCGSTFCSNRHNRCCSTSRRPGHSHSALRPHNHTPGQPHSHRPAQPHRQLRHSSWVRNPCRSRKTVRTSLATAVAAAVVQAEHAIQELETEALAAQAYADYKRSKNHVPFHRATSPLLELRIAWHPDWLDLATSTRVAIISVAGARRSVER